MNVGDKVRVTAGSVYKDIHEEEGTIHQIDPGLGVAFVLLPNASAEAKASNDAAIDFVSAFDPSYKEAIQGAFPVELAALKVIA